MRYNEKRERQIDIATAVSQVVSSIFGEKVEMILPSLEDAKRTLEKSGSNQDGIVKKIWWQK